MATLAIGHDYRAALSLALASKEEWCKRHGYEYVLGGEECWDRDRPIPWSKIGFVLGLLSRIPEGAFVFLSDADVMITNPALTLEEVVVPLLPPEKDLLVCIDACGHINSGNMLMRNTAWLRDFWQRMGEQRELTYHIWWENAALIKLLETVPDDLAHTEVTTEHKKFNAYLQGLPGQPMWEPGDLLVHFAGVYDLETMKALQEKLADILAKSSA